MWKNIGLLGLCVLGLAGSVGCSAESDPSTNPADDSSEEALSKKRRSVRDATPAEWAAIEAANAAVDKAWNNYAKTPAQRAADVLAVEDPEFSFWNAMLPETTGIFKTPQDVLKHFTELMSPGGLCDERTRHHLKTFSLKISADGNWGFALDRDTLFGANVGEGKRGDVPVHAQGVWHKQPDGSWRLFTKIVAPIAPMPTDPPAQNR